MNSADYDKFMDLLMEELSGEYPDITKVLSIIETSNCPYLKEILLDSIKSIQNIPFETLKIIDS